MLAGEEHLGEGEDLSRRVLGESEAPDGFGEFGLGVPGVLAREVEHGLCDIGGKGGEFGHGVVNSNR